MGQANINRKFGDLIKLWISQIKNLIVELISLRT
jgi:hypothetical protein